MNPAGAHSWAAALTERPALDTQALAQRAADLALEMKALDVVMVDVRGRSSYADFIIVASGTSDRHVQSVAELVETTLRKEGVRIVGAEGAREGQWALIDFGSVVVHVFHQFSREVYDIESIWKQAPRTRITDSAPAHARVAARAR